MKLLEHEAKKLLSESGVPIPRQVGIEGGDIHLPAVFKSQVPVGGRGKAGGVVIVEHEKDINPTIELLRNTEIKGYVPSLILIEEKLAINKELYLSLFVDRDEQNITLMAHTNGGVEVEENHDFKIWHLAYDRFDVDAIGQELADYYELSSHAFVLQDLLENLYVCFVKNDALMIEINPLVFTDSGDIIAGDCKMTLDDAAAFRHDWRFQDKPAEVNFVTIDPNGEIATIANGAGLAMATVDAVYDAGLRPANFLDIGGGANTETLLKAFRQLIRYGDMKAIVINIFAGITKADEVALAIIAAKEQLVNLPPLFIRIAGTNYEPAVKLLEEKGISIMPSLDDCLSAAKEGLHG